MRGLAPRQLLVRTAGSPAPVDDPPENSEGQCSLKPLRQKASAPLTQCQKFLNTQIPSLAPTSETSVFEVMEISATQNSNGD